MAANNKTVFFPAPYDDPSVKQFTHVLERPMAIFAAWAGDPPNV
jgi:hypothetical protein